MRVLLDTNVFLWANSEPARLGRQRAVMEDQETDLLVSAASSWEIAIKWALGRLALPEPPTSYMMSRLQVLDATALAITHEHASAVAELPAHHRDPFDRLLIAQARLLGVPIITADRAFDAYEVELLWV